MCYRCSSAIAYFRRSRTPFERIIELNGDPLEVIKKETGKERAELWRHIAATAHRLLKMSPRIFSELWNWSPFYTLLHHPDDLVRWHAAEGVSLLLRMNDSTRIDFLQNTLSFTPDFLVSARFPSPLFHLGCSPLHFSLNSFFLETIACMNWKLLSLKRR